jgi:hypothetical protein
MNEQTFSLQPFSDNEPLSNLKIAGNIARNENLLIISYALLGDIKEVEIPPLSDTAGRSHELWQETCFEFFLGVKDSPGYWEFNLTSTGDWNIYHFDNYRQGMQEETAFTTLPFSVQHSPDCLAIALDIDLDKIVPADQILEIAITAVIKQKNGEVTYWALTHQGAEADFHRRDSFIIEL